MSVTIRIANNFEYVDQNCPELIRVTRYEADGYYPAEEFKSYPFELNMANCNFGSLWRILGLDCGDFEDFCCGSISPELLLAAIDIISVKSFTRDDEIFKNKEGRVRAIDCGVNLEKAARYIWTLRQIAGEAKRRGESIVWA